MFPVRVDHKVQLQARFRGWKWSSIHFCFSHSEAQRVGAGTWSWGRHWRSYFTVTCSGSEAGSGWLDSEELQPWLHVPELQNLQPGGKHGLPGQAPSSFWSIFYWNPYCPFVLKMGRPSNQLKDVPVMLHYMPGLRFGISILSFPRKFLAPRKIDSLLPRHFCIPRYIGRSTLCQVRKVLIILFPWVKCLLLHNLHNWESPLSGSSQSLEGRVVCWFTLNQMSP